MCGAGGASERGGKQLDWAGLRNCSAPRWPLKERQEEDSDGCQIGLSTGCQAQAEGPPGSAVLGLPGTWTPGRTPEGPSLQSSARASDSPPEVCSEAPVSVTVGQAIVPRVRHPASVPSHPCGPLEKLRSQRQEFLEHHGV